MNLPYMSNTNGMSSEESQIEYYKYLQPIVSGCGGFIKSNGYMVVNHDVLLLMSHDRAFLSIIPIKPLNLIYIAEIKAFTKAKNNPESFMQSTYFIGSMQIYFEIIAKYNSYNDRLNQLNPEYTEDLTPYQIYQEDLMSNLEGFDQAVSSTSLSWINFNDGVNRHRICVSKAIFPLNKGDSSSISIFNLDNDKTRTIRYRIHKNKLKLYADIITRQLIFDSTV